MAAEGLLALALTGLSLSVMSGRNGSGWGVAANVAIFIAFLVRRHTLRLMFVLAAAGGAMQLVDPHAFIIFGDFLYAPICAELGVHRDARVRRLGLITGAPFVLPRLVAIFGRLLGAGPDARIARRNAVADPMRTTRATLGLVIGVLLGSVGAQSLIGAGNDGFIWGLPFEVLAVIVRAALALVLVAALPPARRATTVTPVEALRVV